MNAIDLMDAMVSPNSFSDEREALSVVLSLVNDLDAPSVTQHADGRVFGAFTAMPRPL
jgi:hypothetical protein